LYARSPIDTYAALTKAKLSVDPRSMHSSGSRWSCSRPQLDDAFAKQTVDSCCRVSSADLKIVWTLMTNAAADQRMAMRRANADAQKAMQASGLTDSTVSTQLAAAFDAAAQQTWQSFAGALYSKQGLADVLAYRGEYRAAHRGTAGTPPP
jgi:hypothetical protein